jgi:integrase
MQQNELSPGASLIDAAIGRWCAHDTPANTGPRGHTEARRLCEAFLASFGPAPFASVSEASIFEWLALTTREPRWCVRSRRPNRTLPSRIISALLWCGGCTHAASIIHFRPRKTAGVELVMWQRELETGIAGRPFDVTHRGDNQMIWNAYVSEWSRSGGTWKSRSDRHRFWIKHTSCVMDDVCAPLAPPGLPMGFDDPSNLCIDPYLRFFVSVRWCAATGNMEAMDLFRTLTLYCDRIDDEAHSVTMRAYIRPFYTICASLCSGGDGASLIATLDQTTRTDCIAALRCITHDKGRCVKCVYQFTAGGPWAPLLRWSHWRPISRREANYRPPKRVRTRDRFTDGEILEMQKCALSNPFSHGLLTFLLHTGCRTGAVCHLAVRDLVDSTGLRPVGSVREKGGVCRIFCIDPILANALQGAIRCNRGSEYVFPANGGVHRRNKTQNAVWLQQLCNQARVFGNHVHMHAIRRTVISRLLDCGNSLSAVSSWIGHSSPTMTYAMALSHSTGVRAPCFWLLGTGPDHTSTWHVPPMAYKQHSHGAKS